MKSSWTDRLNQMELSPPENGWEKIAEALDESLSGHEFPERLYHLESEPPPALWINIQESLEGKTTPESLSTPRLSRAPFVRYAVAACLIGVISFAAFRIFSSSKIKQAVVSASPVTPLHKTVNADSNANSVANNPDAHTETEKEAQALEESKHTYAGLDLPRHTSRKIHSRLYRSPVPVFSSSSGETKLEKNPEIQYSHRAAVNDTPEDNDASRYLMFRDNEGRFIKISKKLSGLFCCVSGEEQDENCHDQLKKWREKIASSSFVPSPDNFMDILELVSSLQDNRN